MHELSIAASILETVKRQAAANGGGRVKKAGVRIGALSGVDTESLRFCFGAIVAGTREAGCELEIEFEAAGEALDLAWVDLEDG